MLIDDEKDARAFRPGVGAIEALLDSPIQVQPQHYERPRVKRSACGVTGQVAFTASAVTCPECRAYVTKRGIR